MTGKQDVKSNKHTFSFIFIFLTERIVYFLNTVHCYNILEEYYCYEIQLHKALFDFAVDKGYCWLKEGLPPPTHKGITYFLICKLSARSCKFCVRTKDCIVLVRKSVRDLHSVCGIH